MKPRDRRSLFALAILGALVAIFAARVLASLELPRFNLEHTKFVGLDARTKALLKSLDGEVLATFCVSSREKLPSSERRLERDVRELLERMQAESRGRFVAQVLDPDLHPELGDWFTRQGVAPFALREVRSDSFAERSVHASLVLDYGAHGKHVLRGLSSAHVDDLELLIDQHLNELAHPSRPKIAIANGQNAHAFAALLAENADVVSVDFEHGAPLAEPCEFFVWLDPEHVDAAEIAELERFLAHGSSVIIAGSRWNATSDVAAKSVTFTPNARAFAQVAAEFGVEVDDELVLDLGPRERVAYGFPEHAAAVRSIAPDQDFRWLASQPNGSLFFLAPSALELDPAKQVERGYVPHVLASSGAKCVRRAAPSGATPESALDTSAASDGAPLGRESLAVLLAPKDPWSGSLCFFGSSSPFRDGFFERSEFAHANLARSLALSLASSERTALVRAHRRTFDPLPELAPFARLAWRAFVVALVPALLFGFALLRGALSPGWFARLGASRELAFAFVLVLLLGASGWIVSSVPDWLRVDATQDRRHALAPATRAIAERMRGETISVELLASQSLPPTQAATLERARVLFADLSRVAPNLSVRRRVADDLSNDERAEFARDGIAARAVESRDESALSLRSVVLGARLSCGDKREGVDLSSSDAENVLEFRIACALERLGGAKRPRVAVAADAPRLSPAEARELYEARHLFAPTENDVYGAAGDLLAENGFDVVRIDPARPIVPDDIDLLVWLQPRRDTTPMLEQLVAHLRRGVNAIVAGEHYIVQARRLGKDRLELAHWPRPQFADLERGWFAAIGAPLAKEVLCDASSAAMDVGSELEARDPNSSNVRGLELASSTQPFQIRALPENFDAHSAITAGLSDQLLPYANRIALDREKLAANGLRATELIRTSPTTWSIDWKGGDLKSESLSPPATISLGGSALAVLLEGSFPALDPKDASRAASARLLMIGDSELFKSTRLEDSEYRGADLWLSSVAALALSDDHAAILARRATRRGFAPPSEDARLVWRSFAIFAGPAFALLFALLVRRIGARRVPGVVA